MLIEGVIVEVVDWDGKVIGGVWRVGSVSFL
jgi:hypothetical protein